MKRFISLMALMVLVAGSTAFAEESGCFQSTDNWIIRVFSEGAASPYKIMLAVIDPATGLRVPHNAIKAFSGGTPACRNLDRAATHLCEVESAALSPDLSLGCDAVAGTAYIIHDQGGYPTISTIPDIAKSTASNSVLQVTPPFLGFGKVTTGRKTLSVTVTNGGTTDVNISSVTMPVAPFRKTLDTCTGVVLRPTLDTCSISITFAPVTIGSYTGSFDVNSNGGNVSVLLTGTK